MVELSGEYLTPTATAEYLHMSEFTLQRHRMNGTGPTYIKLGHRTLLYRKADVDDWMTARRCDRTKPIDLGELELDGPP
jgi:predicted DNA-binding transcriptional regulator AlpA